MATLADGRRKRRPIQPSYVWPWLFVSSIAHGVVVLMGFSIVGIGGSGLPSWGAGTGGPSIEFEIEGPDGPVDQVAPAAALEEQPVAEHEEVDDGQNVPRRRARTMVAREPSSETAHTVPEPPESTDEPAEEEPRGEEEAAALPPRSPEADVGRLILGSTGAAGDSTSARHALLANRGFCSDPVAGTWQAQKFRGGDHTWVRFILRVRRGEGNELTGSITSRIWTGRATSAAPGPCTAFGMDHTWRMQARGQLEGDRLTFRSRSARLVRQHCPRTDSRYAPDRFSGTLHAERELFEATNNDGAFDIDEPYTFRRVSCHDD